jgi:DNA helicase-2/ATP-dependent DNA helicase PcrA
MLDDLREAGVATTVTWVGMPEPNADGVTVNPRLAAAVTVAWPAASPEGRPGVDAAAHAVEKALRAQAPAGGPMWARVRMLLAEEQSRQRATPPATLLGRHLSTSALVALARDPDAYAAAVRRPMPAPVAAASRRGTAFHAWVEENFGQASMVDWMDLPGSADEGQNPEPELTRLRELFLASEWAHQKPLAVESSVETVVDGIAIRGRIDAVFPRPGGGVTLVDWKTGPQPSGRSAEVAALQLGAYALAYRRLHDLPVDAVEAAFYYAPTGETVRVALPGEEDIRAILVAVPIADPPAAARTVT